MHLHPKQAVPNSLNLQIKKSSIKSLLDEVFQEELNQNLSASLDTSCQIEPYKSKLQCWGDNSNDILNIPSVFNNHTTFVVTGPWHACAMTQVNARENNRKNDTQGAQCWGRNVSGGTEIPKMLVYSDLRIGMGFTCAHIIAKMNQDVQLGQNMFACQGSQTKGNMTFIEIEIPENLTQDIQYYITGISHVLIHKTILQCIGLNLQGECNIPREKFENESGPLANNNYNQQQHQSNDRRNSDSSQSSNDSQSLAQSKTSITKDINDPLQYLYASAGQCHSCAINSSYSMSCWGLSNYGQNLVPLHLYRPIYQGVQAGFAHNCAETVNGIQCWGENRARQAAGYKQYPGELKQLSVGGWHNCILRGEGVHANKFDNVQCWGQNNEGQCLIPKGLNVRKT